MGLGWGWNIGVIPYVMHTVATLWLMSQAGHHMKSEVWVRSTMKAHPSHVDPEIHMIAFAINTEAMFLL